MTALTASDKDDLSYNVDIYGRFSDYILFLVDLKDEIDYEDFCELVIDAAHITKREEEIEDNAN